MRRLTAVLAAVAFASLSVLVGVASPARAAPGDPFPTAQALVFVGQGTARGDPTTLYQAVQGAGAVTFTNIQTAPRSTVGYNAIGFHQPDMYLYAVNDNNRLVRIGQGGAVTNLGLTGLPLNTALNFNQGTFGDGPTADVLYVRLAQTDRVLYAVNVVTQTTTTITLSANVPNISDFTYLDGFLWGVYGEGSQVYRLNPTTGAVAVVAAPAGILASAYGAQWTYGNGNIGISNNATGRVYQLAIDNELSATPTLRVVSTSTGPSNTQNDGASYLGLGADMSITKSAPATFVSGTTVSYTLIVTNNGPGASSGYVVRDVLPTQLTNPTTTTAGCAIALEGASNVLTCTGPPLGIGVASAPITVSGAMVATTCVSNTDQVIGNESDPVFANNAASATTCPAGQTPPSFTVAKTADVTAPASVLPGGTVTYTVLVTNTGTTDYTVANPASFFDALNNVVDDAIPVPGSVTATTGTASFVNDNLNWSGPLPAGATATVTYQVQVNNPDVGDHLLTNAVVPGGTGTCAAPGACDVVTPVASYDVTKAASAPTAAPGSTLEYIVTVTNTGQVDYTAGNPATFTDDLSGVLDDATFGSGSVGTSVTGTTLTWSGTLPVGGTVTVTYSVIVNNPATGNLLMTNTVSPTGPGGSCVVDCTTDTPVQLPQSFTTAKTVSTAEAAEGDVVTYTVSVTNTGQVAYTTAEPASFTDDLAAALDDASYNNDATGGATVTAGALAWSGALPLNATITITYSLTVNTPDTGDHHLLNSVVPGTGGTCATPEQCATDTPVGGFTVAKTASAATAAEGDTVTYTVTVTNTGQVAYTPGHPASFTDELTAVLDDATYNNDATAGATVSAGTLSWSGAVGIGASLIITYSVTVDTPDLGDLTLTNGVVPGTEGACAAPSSCTTEIPVEVPRAYTVSKSVSTTTAAPGDVITYTLLVTNTGTVPLTSAAPAMLSDDLTGVLDDATYNNDATSGANVSGSSLTWSGELAVGATATITYSVTVNDPDLGDRTLPNTVVPASSTGSCDPALTCQVSTTITLPAPTPSPTPDDATLSATGSAADATALAVLLTLGTGLTLLLVSRRART